MRKPRRVEIYPTDLIVPVLGLDAATKGVYLTLCARIIYDGHINNAHLAREWGCRKPTLQKALDILTRHGAIEITESGEILIGWCREAHDKAAARPPKEEWERLRSAVFERDAHTCRYCGCRGGKLECDHVVPASRGGHATMENLVTACKACNRGKRDRTPEEWVQ